MDPDSGRVDRLARHLHRDLLFNVHALHRRGQCGFDLLLVEPDGSHAHLVARVLSGSRIQRSLLCGVRSLRRRKRDRRVGDMVGEPLEFGQLEIDRPPRSLRILDDGDLVHLPCLGYLDILHWRIRVHCRPRDARFLDGNLGIAG